MKIAITTSGKDLDAPVDPRLGRAQSFILYDTETAEWSLLDNAQGVNAAHGAGVQAGSALVNAGVEAVLTGNAGPRAFQVLSASKIKVYVGLDGTVREAIEQFKAGNLQAAGGASVGSHFGIGM